jgi:hypothetical protein
MANLLFTLRTLMCHVTLPLIYANSIHEKLHNILKINLHISKISKIEYYNDTKFV